MAFPILRQTVVDSVDVRRAAEFYRQLLGWTYRAGDETGEPDWLVLVGPEGQRLGFQQTEVLARSTWPDPAVPQQLHLDLTVPDVGTLRTQHDRAIALGATLLNDEIDDPDEPLRAYADPDGHPFCIFVG